MPRFDGTGPQGQGPLTGRGEGYCAVRLSDEPDQAAYGYAGLPGRPVGMRSPAARLTLRARIARWLRPALWPGRALGRGRGRGAGRGRGRAGGRGRW